MNWPELIGAVIGNVVSNHLEKRGAAPTAVPRCSACQSANTAHQRLTLACCGRVLCTACGDRGLVHIDEEKAIVQCPWCDELNTFVRPK